MCDLYYLEQFRDIEKRKAESEAKDIEIDEPTIAYETALTMINENAVKTAFDLIFNKISYMQDDESKERLIYYAIEMCNRIKDDIDANKE